MINGISRKYLDTKGKRVAREIRNLCEIEVNDRIQELIFFLVYAEFKEVFDAGYRASVDDMVKFTEERQR